MSKTDFEIRPICPQDASLLLEAFAFTSIETYFRRFHSFKHGFSEKELQFLTAPDDSCHVACIAVDHSEGRPRLAAVGRFHVNDARPREAEMAIIVHDPFVRHGLGTRIVQILEDRARRMGIHEFRLVVQADNRPMQELIGRVFPDVRLDCRDNSELEFLVGLSGRRRWPVPSRERWSWAGPRSVLAVRELAGALLRPVSTLARGSVHAHH